VIAATDKCVLTPDPFLYEAEASIEPDRPLVESDNPQIQLLQVEGLELV
jgi:hypothetical protein